MLCHTGLHDMSSGMARAGVRLDWVLQGRREALRRIGHSQLHNTSEVYFP